LHSPIHRWSPANGKSNKNQAERRKTSIVTQRKPIQQHQWEPNVHKSDPMESPPDTKVSEETNKVANDNEVPKNLIGRADHPVPATSQVNTAPDESVKRTIQKQTPNVEGIKQNKARG